MSSSRWPLAANRSSRPSRSASKKNTPNVSSSRVFGPRPVEIGLVDERHLPVLRHIQGRHLVGEVADRDPQGVVVAERCDVDPHRSPALPSMSNATPTKRSDLLERPVLLIVKQKVLHGVVGDDDVEPAVAIEVGKRHAERLGHRLVGRRRAHLQVRPARPRR